jgi:hypothetical protein
MMTFLLAGCRGIAGPFPPPLWIRAPCGAIELCWHNIIGHRESQFREPYREEIDRCRLPLLPRAEKYLSHQISVTICIFLRHASGLETKKVGHVWRNKCERGGAGRSVSLLTIYAKRLAVFSTASLFILLLTSLRARRAKQSPKNWENLSGKVNC